MEERRRVNEQIRIPQIMVIGDGGEALGLMSPEEGRRIAFEQGLDLVEVAPNARPPVCKIMDYGRFRYEQRKRTKKQHQTETKILKLRPKTDPHDLETKLRHARRFLEDGDRVRFVVRMRGRERAVTERWVAQLNSLIDQLKDVATVTGPPTLEGGGVTATIEPRRAAGAAHPEGAPAPAPAPRPAAPAAAAPAAAPAAPPASPAPGASGPET